MIEGCFRFFFVEIKKKNDFTQFNCFIISNECLEKRILIQSLIRMVTVHKNVITV